MPAAAGLNGGVTGFLVLLAAAAIGLALAAAYVRFNGRFRDTKAVTLTRADIGADLGDDVTLVQFSSAFCAPCRGTRIVLGQVAGERPDVAYVEIDAESHLDLVRRLGITRTPTVLVLDSRGRIRHRASGQPTRHQVEHVVDAVAMAR